MIKEYIAFVDDNILGGTCGVTQEEIVRCRDCRWYDKGENVAVSWEFCKLHRHNTRDDGYCHRGDRREE